MNVRTLLSIWVTLNAEGKPHDDNLFKQFRQHFPAGFVHTTPLMTSFAWRGAYVICPANGRGGGTRRA